MEEVQDTSCVEEIEMEEQLQHSSKWTHSISCQAINIVEKKSSVFSFVTSWLIVSLDILTWMDGTQMVTLGTFTGVLKFPLILGFCNEITTLMK